MLQKGENDRRLTARSSKHSPHQLPLPLTRLAYSSTANQLKVKPKLLPNSAPVLLHEIMEYNTDDELVDSKYKR